MTPGTALGHERRYVFGLAVHVSESDIQRLALSELTTNDSLRVQKHLFDCGPCLRKLIEFELQLAHKDLIDGRLLVQDAHKPLLILHDSMTRWTA